MPRRRMIDPDIWHDPWFGHLEPIEQIFWVGIISNADDSGRLLAEPAYLRSHIFAYKDVTLESISTMLQKFKDTNPNFFTYNSNGTACIYLKRWQNYQNISHPSPSKLPIPPIPIIDKKDSKPKPEQFGNDSGNSPNSSGNDSPQLISIINKDIIKQQLDNKETVVINGATYKINKVGDSSLELSAIEGNSELLSVVKKNVFSLYEDEIGNITPGISEVIKDAIKEYSEDWICEAINIARDNNKRKWSYIEAILSNWKTDGKGKKKELVDKGRTYNRAKCQVTRE